MVAALNSIAIRTIAEGVSPSRMLMTSRIDQGLSPTAVIKISGLNIESFKAHLNNLCQLFELSEFSDQIVNRFFEVSNGSPLFAASLVRFVKLGENAEYVPELWLGQDGEEVRKFAFERELKRLASIQARLLYAVILLGETSLNDLASVLTVTVRAVRDAISELQSYHLVSAQADDKGESTIRASSDLSAVASILEQHLGKNLSSMVAQACALAQERSSTSDRTIGLSIRNIVSAWDAQKADEGVIIASKLKSKFPKNKDVLSIYGAALLRINPPRAKEADVALEESRKMGCSRPELLENHIKAKTWIEDWAGLYSLTKPILSNSPHKDVALTAFVHSASKLIAIYKDRNEHKKVSNMCLEVVEKIALKTNRRLDQDLFQILLNHKFDFAREYIDALERSCTRAGDRIIVFEGVSALADSQVLLSDLIEKGKNALKAWWSDIEQRDMRDETAVMILGKQIKRLDKLEKQVMLLGDQSKLRSLGLGELGRDLGHRAMKYLE